MPKKTKKTGGPKKATVKQMQEMKKDAPVDVEAIEGELIEDEDKENFYTFGRPTVMTRVVKQKLLEAFSWGCSNKEAALYAGIAERTLDHYNKKNPKFKEYCSDLKESPTLTARRTLVKSLDESAFYSLKYLERKKPKEFAMRVQQMFEDPEPMTPEEQKLLDQAIDENL